MTEPPRPRLGGVLSALPPFAIPVPLAFIQVGGTIASAHADQEVERLNPVLILLLLAGPVCLTARRRYPLPTLFAVAAVTLVYLLLGGPFGPVGLSLALSLFNAVRRGPRVVAWVSCWAIVAGIVTVASVVIDEIDPDLTGYGGIAAWLLTILIIAEIVKARQERAASAAAAQQAQAKREASEERLRIAREVHDVLAHHVSLINVQSGVALHLIDAQPEQAREALATIKQSSKEVLVELRNILGVLRAVDSDSEPPKHPVASLDQLDALAERMRAAGLPVEVRTEGDRRTLPSGVDAAALRIIQESLTNTYRHAGPARATVRLCYLPDALRIEVADDGRGDSPASSAAWSAEGGGHGLTGMRQRAEVLGGTLVAAPRPEGGFLVTAVLPTTAADTDSDAHTDAHTDADTGTGGEPR